MGLQEEEEVIKERSPIAERIWSNDRSIQEDQCRMYTGGLVRDLYREKRCRTLKGARCRINEEDSGKGLVRRLGQGSMRKILVSD